MKICESCGKEFKPSKNDKRIKYCCAECRIVGRKINKYMQNYYENNKEKWERTEEKNKRRNELRRKRYREDEEYRNKLRQKSKEYHKRKPEIKFKERMKKYNITPKDYENILRKQDGKCAICGSSESQKDGTKRFFVDHNHNTGKVRGLLCSKCNFGIGQFNDDVELLKNAIKYLKGCENNE